MKKNIEIDVKKILKKDGVKYNDFDLENSTISNIKKIIKDKKGKKSWSKRIINSKSNSVTLISQQPGEGNRKHYHPNWNEWWLIIDGQWQFEIDKKIYKIKKNDIVFIEKNKIHKITALGKKPALRLAVSRSDVKHIYV